MYESPIEMISRRMRTQQEENVYKTVLEVGVNVDKDELIKALKYDRDQYNRGYNDGFRECIIIQANSRACVAEEVIDDLAREGLLNVEPWAIAELKKKYTEGK
jgi:hypothetical protein